MSFSRLSFHTFHMEYTPGKLFTAVSSSLDYNGRKFIPCYKEARQRSRCPDTTDIFGAKHFVDDDSTKYFLFLKKEILYKPMPFSGGLVFPVKSEKDDLAKLNPSNHPYGFQRYNACVDEMAVYWFLQGEEILFLDRKNVKTLTKVKDE